MKHLSKIQPRQLMTVLLIAALNMIAVPALSAAVKIGDGFQGGIVFYVDQTGKHGLTACAVDFGTRTMTWREAVNFINEYNQPPDDSCLVGFVDNWGDWRLPTKEELTLLYLRRSVVGFFAKDLYWSSTDGIINAYALNFKNGEDGFYNIGSYARVRAIREF
jgi:hypothetical protein